MSKKNTILYFLNWFLRWFLTTLFGMVFFFPDGFEFLGYTPDVNGRELKTRSLLRVKGRNGAWTETQIEGNVSPHDISSTTGTMVEVRNVLYGNISGMAFINIVTLILNIIVLAAASMDLFYPAMRRYNTEPGLLTQIILMVLILFYLFNLLFVFIRGYTDNLEKGIKPVINKLITGISICLTLVYVVWFVMWLATTKLGIYFPFKYFSVAQ